MGKDHIGGQAVIEGVLMLSRDNAAVSVRTPEGDIETNSYDYQSLTKKEFFGWPFIRGVVVLFEMLFLGMRALSWSATMAGEEEEELSRWEIVLTIVFSLGLALVLFKLIPLLVASLAPSGESNFLFNLVDGVAKIIILVAYIWAISLMEDVKRIFQYHAAEHKTINCYQQDKKLTKKNILAQPKEHTSCGTSFILLVLLVSILFYMVIPLGSGFWTKLLFRILLLPVIAGTTYEIIKLASKNKENAFFKFITYPGIMLQWITTREPEEDMIEVAVKSLKEVT